MHDLRSYPYHNLSCDASGFEILDVSEEDTLLERLPPLLSVSLHADLRCQELVREKGEGDTPPGSAASGVTYSRCDDSSLA